VLRALLKRPGATVNQRLRLADLLVQLGKRAEAVPVFLALAEDLAADGFVARAIAALKRVEKLEPGRPDVEARLSALALQGRPMSIMPGATPLPSPSAPPTPPAFEIGIEEVGSDTLARRQDESVKRALRRVAEAEAAAGSDPESAGTSDVTAFAMIEPAPAVPQGAVDESAAAESAGAGPVEPEIIFRESAVLEADDSGPAGVEPPEPDPPPSPPPGSDQPGSESAEDEPDAWPSFPGQASREPISPQTVVAPPLPRDAIESAQTQPPSPEGPGPAPSGVAQRLRGVFRRFLAALPASPADLPPGDAAGTELAAPPLPTDVPTGESEPPVVESEPPVAESEPPVEGAQTEAVAAPPAPEVQTAETEPTGDTAKPEIAAPVLEIDAPPEAPAAMPEAVAAEPEPVSEPLDEDLPTLSLDDVPTSESEDDELPTLELDEEEADEPESDTEPVTAEPILAELAATEAVAAEPLASLADSAEAEPITITPEAVPAALEAEAIVASAEPPEADPEALVDLPPAAAPARPAARPSRTGELEEFIALSEDVFQDQVADLIEEMLVPGGEPSGSASDAPPAPARSLLSGPLFEGLSDDERVALVRGLKLRTFEAGDVILTEGEPGSSLFLLTAGAVRVFVRNPAGSNRLLDDLGEGDFFGEISILSGRPRNATVTAAALCEMLELDQTALAEIQARYPRVSERLESFSHDRAVSTAAAALRDGGIGPGDSSLESHFDDGRLQPRLRLRLADAFLKAGQEREAAQVLIDLADDLVRRGQNEKAVALLKKVEQLQHRPRGLAARPADAAPAPGKGHSPGADDRLGNWLIDVARDTVRRRSAVASRGLDAPVGQALDPRTLRVYRRGLVASPLFEGLSEDELLALVRGLQLRTVDPGDIVLTEGEPGQSIFIVATGQMKVFIRNATGHDVPLCGLSEGAFFGEISALSGRSRTATVTAAAPSVLLELDQPALEVITRAHPRVQEILETVYIERASDPSAEAIRGQP
jgi:CRP-like cAMP-binding protein